MPGAPIVASWFSFYKSPGFPKSLEAPGTLRGPVLDAPEHGAIKAAGHFWRIPKMGKPLAELLKS